MLHLLKIEWLKVKNYRTFWILFLLFVASMAGFNYTVFQGYNSRPKSADMILKETPYAFPDIWQTITYWSSFLLFIPALLMIISLTNEFSFKTHRQNIIDGLSRTQFILVKFLFLSILALVCTITVFLTTIIFGIALGEHPGFTNSIYIFYFFIQALSYSFVGLLFGLLFRRSGIAIGVFFLYVLVFDELVADLLKKYVGKIGYYMPLESNDVLITIPFGKRAINQLTHRPEPIYLLIAALAYLLFYFIFCKRNFETADL
jgi:ABC-2 type transport system permease protein